MNPYIYLALRIVSHIGAALFAGIATNSIWVGLSIFSGLSVLLMGLDTILEEIQKINSAAK